MVDRLRNSEANARRIANVETAFGSSGSPLQIPGRVLVGEGVLIKMCRKKPKPRQFFLFNDLFIYGSILISKKRYNKQHIIPLEEVKLESLEDVGYSKHGWLIKTKTKSFAVYAATESEKREWMSHIERCIQDLLSIGRIAPSEYAAVWIPDGEATKCMCCRSAHFSHHCRACGNVVCRGCSSKSFLLNGISKKPVRVCDTCYNKLCQGMSTNSNISNSLIENNNDSSDNSDEEFNESFEAPTFYGASTSNLYSNKNLEYSQINSIKTSSDAINQNLI